MTETFTAPDLVARFVWDQDDEDEFCIDRATGKTVVRYDLGDPANYSPAYGGWSKDEWLEKKGLDPRATVDVAKAAVRIPPGEAERFRVSEERRRQREQEEAVARDLMSFLSHAEVKDFDFGDYRKGETEILEPALAKRGFTNIGFYMGEQDSFGPLSRGCVALDPTGKRVRFFYG